MRPAGLLQASLDRVLPTKLRPPQLRDQRVTRWRLLAQLDATQSKAVLVVAPAGFGKTTLLVQWASESANSVAWISLGPKDNALARFLAYVVAALSGVDPELPEYVRQHLIQTEESGPSALADAVLHAVERSRQPWSLVFDDFHAISDPAIHDFIAALIDVLPAGCRLIVLSRSEPQFKVARLQMLDDLIVLTENDLRATEDECIALLSQNGIDPSGTDLAALVEHTTGWLVAIHCIALACRNESVDRVIAAIATRDNKLDMLHAYLFEEVLGRESPELRAFLLRIAILDRFTVDACFAVTGSTSAGQLIKWTRRSGFFLVGLDEGGAWFRFHHLFREFLLRQLQIDVDPRSIRELYAAASHWFEQHNLIEEAISYAVRAEDWPKATAMITSVAAELLTSDRLVGLWEWVHSFPSDVIFADPNLSSITGYALIRQGRVSEAEPYIAAVEACWQAEQFTGGQAVVAVMRAAGARFREDAVGLIAHGANAIEQATGEPPLTPAGALSADIRPRVIRLKGTWLEKLPHMMCYNRLALGLVCAGRLAEAETLVQRVWDVHAAVGIEQTTSTTSAQLLALLRLAQGRLDAAESVARTHVHQASTDYYPIERVMVMQPLAEVLYEWDRLDEAEQCIRDGLLLLQHIGSSVGTPALRICLARIRWARGDAMGALDELDAAASAAAGLQNLFRLREIDALRTHIALAAGDLAHAREWVIRRGLSPDSDLATATFAELLVLARALIATGETESAVQLLGRLRPPLEQSGRRHDLIRLLVVESLAHLDLFELDHAVEALGAALDIGEAGPYQRVFLEEGEPMIRLLKLAHRRGQNPLYIGELLEAAGHAPVRITRVKHQDLVEPISSREIEVLRLIAHGLTNREISEELYLSTGTVKRHITNLYGKLGVSSRTDAVQQARKLGLLSHEKVTVRRLTRQVPVR